MFILHRSFHSQIADQQMGPTKYYNRIAHHDSSRPTRGAPIHLEPQPMDDRYRHPFLISLVISENTAKSENHSQRTKRTLYAIPALSVVLSVALIIAQWSMRGHTLTQWALEDPRRSIGTPMVRTVIHCPPSRGHPCAGTAGLVPFESANRGRRRRGLECRLSCSWLVVWR